MKDPSGIARVTALGVLVFACVAFASLSGCKNQPGSDDEQSLPQAQKGPAQISAINGETVMTLDPATQTRLGLIVAPLATTTTRAQETFAAVILSPTDLATMRGNLLAAEAQLQKARVQADVANKEYSRLKTLYAQDQDISQKSLEAAEGSVEVDQTDVTAAQQQVDLQKSLIGEQWGSTMADWVQRDSPAFERVLDQRDALVQVTMPADAPVNQQDNARGDTQGGAPASITVQNLEGAKTQANLVSTFPRVDPRIQGRSFLYVMSPHRTAAPGMSLVAYVSVGGEMKGVVVPTSAVVWSEGRAWVYQQTGPSDFTQREVPTDLPLAAGYFVAKALPAGGKVVTVGAQALLSEEFLLRGASAGANND